MQLQDIFPVWSKLTPAQQKKFSASAVSRTIPRGTLIHDGSIDCTGLLLIKTGQLRAYILSEEGREITIYRLFDLDFCLFSASCMMRSIQFTVSIKAEKDTDLWIIPADVYKTIMEESAPLANFTNEIMADRFSEVMWLVEQILWKSFDKRLAEFLLKESIIEGSSRLKLTHETIGSHMGNPREVVTRMLHYFQKEGIVKLSRGTVEITDMTRLQKICDSE